MPQPDFFARQESARRHTALLEVYFLLAIAGTILLCYVIFHFLLAAHGTKPSEPALFLEVSGATLAIIIGGSLFKTSQLAGGGSVVAEMLGGRLVNANTADLDERKLLDVVEEMAIASGTPVPHVYVLPDEPGINAFAAGHSTADMVVCATRGCLRHLTRDELQGVIGHEFSHILNGDMRLNLRLMGLVFGLLCLTLIGRILLRTRGRKNPLPLIGLVLIVAGCIGVFFGKLIKSAVSRQREFLADASAVQFTRNPEGLASALKKVGGCGSRLQDANAEDASHLFFANGLRESIAGMFSTHPPLEQRIRALEPAWDGKFISVSVDQPPRAAAEQLPAVPPPGARRPQLGGLAAAAMPGYTIATAALLQTGAPTPRHLDYAADWRSKLPPGLDAAAREPMSAVALIYALLLSRDDALRATQLEQLSRQTDPGICQQTAALIPGVLNLESRARLPLAALAMSALRRLSPAQYEQFNHNIHSIIESDPQMELFEYTLQKIVLRQLEPAFKRPKRAVIQYYVIGPLRPDCGTLLSALAYAGQTDPAQIDAAFRQGAAKLDLAGLTLASAADCSLARVDAALERLNQGAPQIKKTLLNACAETVAADGVIQESEAELLRAIADTLDCPIPPLLQV
ncbi:MAG: M48 family metalloprotease [Verrucomicrobiota bacterium]|jgi:Zn-dependent protease with chaperone function